MGFTKRLCWLVIFLAVALGMSSTATAQCGVYSHYRVLTVPAQSSLSSDVNNFPVLVSGTLSYLAQTPTGLVQNANGYDVGFFADTNCTVKLPWETETYTASSGLVNYWVQLPTVSKTSSTSFVMAYDDASITTDQSSPASVWDMYYRGVYHLPNGTALNANDSTAFANNGTVTSVTAAPGEIDGGAAFTGTGQIDLGTNLAHAENARTYEVWVYCTAYPSSGNYLAVVNAESSTYGVFDILLNSSGKLAMFVATGSFGGTTDYIGTGTHTLSLNTWYLVQLSYSSTAGLVGYVNGAVDGTAVPANGITLADGDGANHTLIGSNAVFSGRNWKGTLDEVRISGTSRSADWAATSYASQSSPSTFYSIGSQDTGTVSAPAPLVIPFGYVQTAMGSTFIGVSEGSRAAATSTYATLNALAGDTLIAEVFATSDTGDFSLNFVPFISDTYSCTWKASPTQWHGLPPGGYSIFYCPNVHGGPTAVTVSSTTGQHWDLKLTEAHGLGTSDPLIAATPFVNQGNGTSNSYTPNRITLPPGTYYLHGTMGDNSFNGHSFYTYTGTAGFTNTAVGLTQWRAIFDQSVTIASPTTYLNSVTTSGSYAIGGWGGLLAFSTGNATKPRVIQSSQGGAALGFTNESVTLNVPVTPGNAVVVFANWYSSAGTPSCTDNLGNTYTLIESGGSGSGGFSLWVSFPTITSGTLIVNVNPGGNLAVQVEEVTGVQGVDAHSSSLLSSATVVTPSVTTNFANELILSFGGSQGACNSVELDPTTSTPTPPWVYRGFGGAHCAQSLSQDLFESSAGTYANSFTAVSSTDLSSAIVGFTTLTPIGSSNQPIVSVF